MIASMTAPAEIFVLRAGPSVTLQDAGRAGLQGFGLSQGGAMDPHALAEARALLGTAFDGCAIEMGQIGGAFRCDAADLVIALTGAEMRASLDGVPLRWGATHRVPAGAVIEIGAVVQGSYGYLSIAGQWGTPMRMGARGAHVQCGIGGGLAAGTALALSPGTAPVGQSLPQRSFDAAPLSILPAVQTAHFGSAGRAWITKTAFTKTARSSRMGAALDYDTRHTGLGDVQSLSLTSEMVSTGDIQITGDGTPYVLLREAQTTGGYPRIGTVISADLPRFAQLPAGAPVRFTYVTLEQALAARAAALTWQQGLTRAVRPLLRDPAMMSDLLSYSLVSGAISATDTEGWE